MREIKKHIFLETISYENRHMSPRNLYIIRGEERSLMVDTSNNTERDWTILKGMIDALGIDCRKLDIFITHEHPDHTGLVPKLQELGARAFMNPDETRKRVDLLHSYLADERARIENLRIVGVTKRKHRRYMIPSWNIRQKLTHPRRVRWSFPLFRSTREISFRMADTILR